MLSQWIQLFKIYQYRPQIMIWIESESKWIVSPLQRWVMTLWISLLMAEIPAYAQTSVRRLLHADSSGQGQHAASQPHCKHRRQLSHLFNSSLHHHRKTPLMLHHTDSNLYINILASLSFVWRLFFFISARRNRPLLLSKQLFSVWWTALFSSLHNYLYFLLER